MTRALLRGLPPYAGGKRRLVGAVFGAIPAAVNAPVLIDAFLGGGAISLIAKARGHQVVANDIADRSVVVGHALIENDATTLTEDDLVLISTPQNERTYAQTELAPHIFPAEHATYMDTVLFNAERLQGPKQWLAKLLVVKMALKCRPMANFGARKIMQQVADGDWEAMRDAYARDLVKRGIGRHPMRMAETIRQQINASVFSNGLANTVRQGDVIEFLQSVEGDVVYLDPPYPSTVSYEASLRPLDALLAGHDIEVHSSRFTTGEPREVLPPLLEAADHIPIWILSYGNARCDLGELMDIVRAFRPDVTGRAIAYRHMASLATKESQLANRELLVVARRP